MNKDSFWTKNLLFNGIALYKISKPSKECAPKMPIIPILKMDPSLQFLHGKKYSIAFARKTRPWFIFLAISESACKKQCFETRNAHSYTIADLHSNERRKKKILHMNY